MPRFFLARGQWPGGLSTSADDERKRPPRVRPISARGSGGCGRCGCRTRHTPRCPRRVPAARLLAEAYDVLCAGAGGGAGDARGGRDARPATRVSGRSSLGRGGLAGLVRAIRPKYRQDEEVLCGRRQSLSRRGLRARTVRRRVLLTCSGVGGARAMLTARIARRAGWTRRPSPRHVAGDWLGADPGGEALPTSGRETHSARCWRQSCLPARLAGRRAARTPILADILRRRCGGGRCASPPAVAEAVRLRLARAGGCPAAFRRVWLVCALCAAAGARYGASPACSARISSWDQTGAVVITSPGRDEPTCCKTSCPCRGRSSWACWPARP